MNLKEYRHWLSQNRNIWFYISATTFVILAIAIGIIISGVWKPDPMTGISILLIVGIISQFSALMYLAFSNQLPRR